MDDARRIWTPANDYSVFIGPVIGPEPESEPEPQPEPEPEPEPEEAEDEGLAMILYDPSIEGVKWKRLDDVLHGLQYLMFFLSLMVNIVVAPVFSTMVDAVAALGHRLLEICVHLFFWYYSTLLLQSGRPLPPDVDPRDARRIFLAREIPQFHDQICRWGDYTELEMAYAEHYAKRLPFKEAKHLPFFRFIDPRITVHLELVALVNNPRSVEGQRFILLVKQLCALDRICDLMMDAGDALAGIRGVEKFQPDRESIRIAMWRLGDSIMAFYRLSPSMKACNALSPFVTFETSGFTYQSLWSRALREHPTILRDTRPSFRLISPAIIHLQSFAPAR